MASAAETTAVSRKQRIRMECDFMGSSDFGFQTSFAKESVFIGDPTTGKTPVSQESFTGFYLPKTSGLRPRTHVHHLRLADHSASGKGQIK